MERTLLQMKKQNHEILICCLGTEMKWLARLW